MFLPKHSHTRGFPCEQIVQWTEGISYEEQDMNHMSRRDFVAGIGKGALGLASLALLEGAGWAAPDRKPNIVFILIDDMGWRDTAVYGSRFYETPNIDKLASQGMRFTNAYAACPVCSPTRASIMTGKYPARLHLTDWIPGHKFPYAKLKPAEFHMELPLSETTIAEELKRLGYATASIGKWHLGKEPFYPDKQGFDINIAGCNKGSTPSHFDPYKIPTLPTRKEGEYLADRLTDEALGFIEKNKDRPFFLYLPHYAVHTPIQAKKEITAKYQAKVKPDDPQNRPDYAAMVQSVDESIGRVMAKLDELGIADNTIVFFNSDNGGVHITKITSNAPLREGKGTMYEGGIREPLIIRWPRKVKPGSLCDTPVVSTDYYSTILNVAKDSPVSARTVDGMSLMPLITQTGAPDRKAIYWHYPHYHPGGTSPAGAVRYGDWKLIEYFEDGRLELYNLKDDLSETTNLSAQMPDMTAKLHKMLLDWRTSVNAVMPTPNPDYNPARERERPK